MNRLKELRENKGMSQRALAQLMNVSQNTICKWENNDTQMNYSALIKVSQLFQVSVDYVIGNSDDFGVIAYNETDSYTPEEKRIITILRKLSPDLKEIVLNTTTAMEKINANRVEATSQNTKKA